MATLEHTEARKRYALKNEAEDLRRAFDKLDTNKDGKIDAKEISKVCKSLGHPCKKSEVEDMIWEVDDDCDKAVNWPEFQAMYNRCRNDKTGYEPRRLFNVVEFLMNDRDGSGVVTVEEAMQILYLRHGKHMLDEQLNEIFGTSDTSSMSNLNLTEFLHSLNMSQIKQMKQRMGNNNRSGSGTDSTAKKSTQRRKGSASNKGNTA